MEEYTFEVVYTQKQKDDKKYKPLLGAYGKNKDTDDSSSWRAPWNDIDDEWISVEETLGIIFQEDHDVTKWGLNKNHDNHDTDPTNRTGHWSRPMVIHSVLESSWASQMQLKAGDVLRSWGGQWKLELLTNRDIRTIFMEVRPLRLKFLRIREPVRTNYWLILKKRQELRW